MCAKIVFRGHFWSSQYAAENTCLNKYREYNKYIAIFDIDEIITPLQGLTLVDFLKTHSGYDSYQFSHVMSYACSHGLSSPL